jgi:hypothetical protein
MSIKRHSKEIGGEVNGTKELTGNQLMCDYLTMLTVECACALARIVNFQERKLISFS